MIAHKLKPLLGSIVAFFAVFLNHNGSSMRSESARNKWLDGLRGLASFSVITSHLARAFDYDQFLPADNEEATPRFMQWPYMRLWPQGRIGVAIFALMTGFVCGIKPLKQIRAGDPQAALATLSKAAFKRPMRLMLPGTIASIMAFIVCNMGFFTVAARVDASWIRNATPQPAQTWSDEIFRFERNFRGVWTNGHNDYDDHQWTLLPLLKCSLLVYLSLMAVAFLQFRYRMAVWIIMFSYFWQDNRPDTETFLCQAFFGVLLSDLSQEHSFQAFLNNPSKAMFRRVVSVFLIIFGLFIASFPMDHWEWQAWSRAIKPLEFFFPRDTYLPKRFTALGLECFVFGIVLNHTARSFLTSAPLQFLGKYSFAVYLTHGTILKSILVWMIYGISGQPWEKTINDKGEEQDPEWLKRCSTPWFFFWVPIWLVIVYAVAWVWTVYVDAWCERASQWVMKKTFEETPEKSHQQVQNMA